jgi:hypothetical protein
MYNIKIPLLKDNSLSVKKDKEFINIFIGTTSVNKINEITGKALDRYLKYDVEEEVFLVNFVDRSKIQNKEWFCGELKNENFEANRINYNAYINKNVVQGQNLIVCSEHTGFEFVILLRFKGKLKE